MRRIALMVTLAGLAAGCSGGGAPPAKPASGQPVESGAMLFEGLGSHHRAVTTSSPEAQKYFDQGLAFLHAFNHDEAKRAFERATALDPACAMAYWGIAYSNGPHINNPVVPPEHNDAAIRALAEARRHAAGASDVERALIEALGARHASPPPKDRAPLDAAYAETMRGVWEAHPDDPDVGALYGEALMDLHPWDLYDRDGSPKEWTPAIVAHLEGLLAKWPSHPLALHLYIHAVEASSDPGRAAAAADRLRGLAPGLGHLVHMPSHIDVRRGRWREAIAANTAAMEADHRYSERVPGQDFYRLYMAHNHHMRAFACMMIGRSEMALASVREMVADFPPDWMESNASWADGWNAMPFEVLMRFGRWDDVLAEPEPAEYLPLSRALWHYARGIARAAKGEVDEAQREQTAFTKARVRVAPESTFGNNPATAILDVAEAMLDGEIKYRAGGEKEGLAALREAVRREDSLRYDEPPDWIQPVRHALGAALLQSGRYAEAEKVLREDLARLPGNGWSLFGIARALRLQGKNAEAASFEARFAEAWDGADVRIASPCFCQSGV